METTNDDSASAYDWFATATQAFTAYSQATAAKPTASQPPNSQDRSQITNPPAGGSNKMLLYGGIGLGVLLLVVILVKR